MTEEERDCDRDSLSWPDAFVEESKQRKSGLQ